MRTWQPAVLEYPDAELALTKSTRHLMLEYGVDWVGNQLPPDLGQPGGPATAIVWNRVGGADPSALMQCRVYAPTHLQANQLARTLAARLRFIIRHRLGVVAVIQNEGPTDLGNPSGPMRQMMYEIVLRATQHPNPPAPSSQTS